MSALRLGLVLYVVTLCSQLCSAADKTVSSWRWSEKENSGNGGFVETITSIGEHPDRYSDSFYLDEKATESKWYTSQLGQDRFVAQQLFEGEGDGGFYVDLAANDYSTYSNTQGLERYRKWRGICIEPNSQYHDMLLQRRKCDLITSPVYSHNNEMISFTLNDVYGGIVDAEMDNKEKGEETIELATVTLKEILDFRKAPKIIDYLSLDVEGGEMRVLQHLLKHSDYVVKTISIERPTPPMHALLHRHGYWMLQQMPLPNDPFFSNKRREELLFGEIIYIHQSHKNFKHLMDSHRPAMQTDVQWFKTNHTFLLHPQWPPKHAHVHLDITELEGEGPEGVGETEHRVEGQPQRGAGDAATSGRKRKQRHRRHQLRH